MANRVQVLLDVSDVLVQQGDCDTRNCHVRMSISNMKVVLMALIEYILLQRLSAGLTAAAPGLHRGRKPPSSSHLRPSAGQSERRRLKLEETEPRSGPASTSNPLLRCPGSISTHFI